MIIGVIDTGVDYTHPDLATNIFRSPTDCNTNGVDDDEDGYVDDCYGINPAVAYSNHSDPMDDIGHGTHVAGIMGAVGNNTLGVAGLNWNVTLLPCKIFARPDLLDAPESAAIACFTWMKKLKDGGLNIGATTAYLSGYSRQLGTIDLTVR